MKRKAMDVGISWRLLDIACPIVGNDVKFSLVFIFL